MGRTTMRKAARTILSLLLAIAMAFVGLPVQALAEAIEEAPIEEVAGENETLITQEEVPTKENPLVEVATPEEIAPRDEEIEPEGDAAGEMPVQIEDAGNALDGDEAHPEMVVQEDGVASIPVRIVWSDNSDAAGVRPKSVWVYAGANDGQRSAHITGSGDVWTGSIAIDGAENSGNGFWVVPETLEEYTASSPSYGVKYEGETVDITYTIRDKVVDRSSLMDLPVSVQYAGDNDNELGNRQNPVKVTVTNSYNGAKVVAPIEIGADGTGSGVVPNLPISFTNGEHITYSVSSQYVGGYSKTQSADSIDGTSTPETVSVTYDADARQSRDAVVKWMDSDATQRPSSLVVSLEENGAPYSSVNLSASNANVDGNAWTWTGAMSMDTLVNGRTATYTASTNVTGYSVLYSCATPYSGATIILVADNYTPSETIDVPVSVSWEDNGNSLNNRPGEVTIDVYAYVNGNQSAEPVRSMTISAGQGWQGTIKGLPKYDADGNALSYRVVEAVPEFYRVGNSYVECPTTAQASFTNYPIMWTVDVRKQWDDDNDAKGDRPASITVGLYKGAAKIDEMTLSSVNSTNAVGDTWGRSFLTEYPMAENGEEIAYSVREANVANYTAEPMEVSLVGVKGYHKAFGIRNTYSPTVDIPVTKTWDDNDNELNNRPESVTYKLYSVMTSDLRAGGEESNTEPTLVATKTASKDDDYACTFEGLPAQDDEGNAYTYLVGEETVPGYYDNKAYLDNSGYYYSLKNVFDGTNAVNIVNEGRGFDRWFRIIKAWNDEGHEGERPESVTVNLLADKEIVGSVTLSAEDVYTRREAEERVGIDPSYTTWAKLLRGEDGREKHFASYRNGQAIEYTVEEEPVEGYESESSGPMHITGKNWGSSLMVTNTYKKAIPIASATVAPIASQTYTGSAIKPTPAVTLGGKTLTLGTDYALSYANNTNAGTATVTVTGKGAYSGTVTATFQIARAANPLRAKAAKASLSVTYKPKAATVTAGNVAVGGAQGGVTYANASTDVTAKKFAVDKATGKVTVPKATGAGTYAVKVRVTAAGNSNYESGSKTVSYKIVVAKAKQPMVVKAVKRTAKASKLKKKAVTVAAPLKFKKKAQGKVTYAKVAKGSAKCLTVNKKNGKVTVKKGTKEGTYKVKVKVTAKGNRNYKAGSKTVTCKVAVK